MSNVFTCITCHVAFNGNDMQRTHYKSDWHRYNLKRKVVNLPPISDESFNEKVETQKNQTAKNESEENVVGLLCKACQRQFNSYNSFNNHIKSKKHIENENRLVGKLKKSLESSVLSSGDSNKEDMPDINRLLKLERSNVNNPTIVRSDPANNETKKEQKEDNPRLRWYQKQVRALKEAKQHPEEEEEEEWEDMSDDGTIDGEENEHGSESELSESATESIVTDSSSLDGVMSKMKIDSDADIESLTSEQANQRLLTSKDCLFCHRKSDQVDNNIAHMSTQHGFFIPELEYIVNLEGLLTYLGEKVGCGNVCLWCNERGHPFYSLKAVRAHMKDKGHCKLLSEGDAALEYADYYDFSSSYPDYDPSSSENDEEFDDEDAESVIVDEEGEEMELVLPSGARIGHRSLMRYYKQNFPTVQRINQQTRSKRIDRLMAQYKAVGWAGSTSAVVAVVKKQQKDMKFLQKMKAKYMQKLGRNNNKTMMKHLRPQVVF